MPIDIDGLPVGKGEVTIDGEQVEQITVDGERVWQAKEPGAYVMDSSYGNLHAIDLESREKLWEASIGYYSTTPPFYISDFDVVVASAYQERTGGLSPITGDEMWSAETSAYTRPVHNGRYVYIGTSNGVVMYDLHEQGIAKTLPSGDIVRTAPLLLQSDPDDYLAYGDNSGNFIMMNTSTSDVLWEKAPDDTFCNSSPTYSPDTDKIIFPNNAGNMYSLDPSTGETNWEYSTSGNFRKDPIIHNGLIYIPVQGGPNGLLAINESTGQLEWQVDFPDWGDSSPAIYEDAYDGVVYVGDKAGNIRSIDLSTGDTNWLYSSGERIRGAVSITQDGIYFGSSTGYMYHINHDGDFLWKYEVEGTIKSAPWVKDAVWNITEGGVYTAPNIGP